MHIGILGTSFGKRHAEIFTSFSDVNVVGIAGRNEQKTREVAHALGVPAYTDP